MYMFVCIFFMLNMMATVSQKYQGVTFFYAPGMEFGGI